VWREGPSAAGLSKDKMKTKFAGNYAIIELSFFVINVALPVYNSAAPTEADSGNQYSVMVMNAGDLVQGDWATLTVES